MESGDIILDFDAIANAVSGESGHWHPGSSMPFARTMFRAAVRYGRKRPFDKQHIWIIRGAPEQATRNEYRHNYPGIRVVVLETTADVCKERAAAAGRPDKWPEYIDGWWDRYQADSRDEVISLEGVNDGH